jgi:hypothetical protein
MRACSAGVTDWSCDIAVALAGLLRRNPDFAGPTAIKVAAATTVTATIQTAGKNTLRVAGFDKVSLL